MIDYRTEAAVIAMYPDVGKQILTDKIIELCEKVKGYTEREAYQSRYDEGYEVGLEEGRMESQNAK